MQASNHDQPEPVSGDPQAESHSFAFTGSGGEYFRIWIVNLFLSIITVGIYSAWAKVRRERYFHGNLVLDKSTFAYHGNPVAILKGRLVAVVLLFALSAAQHAGPIAYGLAILALLPLAPWLIVRAFRFRAHNTSYRGLRFSFGGSYRQALTAFVGYGLLALLTLGIAFPLFYREQRKFVLDNLRYGGSQFKFGATVWQFYRLFLAPLGVALAMMVVVGVLAAIGDLASQMVPPLIILSLMAMTLFLMPYVRVRSANLVWNHLTLDRMSFSSTLKLLPYFWLVAINLLLLVFTLGLYWPWARVRLARYRASCLARVATESLDNFVATETFNATALGDEVSELMDFDIAL
jgi:uncharacterized membrane protein YjgN (DUF898 family)